jgi:hypothetical protein
VRRLGHRLRLNRHDKGLRGAKRKWGCLIFHIRINVSVFVHLVHGVCAKTGTTDISNTRKSAYLTAAQDAEIRAAFTVLA